MFAFSPLISRYTMRGTCRFTWFVNGFELHDSSGRLEVYYPKENRCVARFPIPQSGEYKVIAENSVGRDQSIGYVDVKKGMHSQKTNAFSFIIVRETQILLARH